MLEYLDKPRVYILRSTGISYFKTILGPKLYLDKPWAYICQSYFLRPQSCKPRIFEDRSNNCIIIQINEGPRNKRGVLLASAKLTNLNPKS